MSFFELVRCNQSKKYKNIFHLQSGVIAALQIMIGFFKLFIVHQFHFFENIQNGFSLFSFLGIFSIFLILTFSN
ncbi:MAG: hypothetical protein D5R98_09340 [Desulfonatronovibrio sp. MSAO_Bac4]|nr:MAG: hypothetical protein D5R98_09340 [Desulfonatronovibrio sp. MSAO_Bac4]